MVVTRSSVGQLRPAKTRSYPTQPSVQTEEPESPVSIYQDPSSESDSDRTIIDETLANRGQNALTGQNGLVGIPDTLL